MRRLRRFEAVSRNFYIRARVRDLLDLPLNLRNLRTTGKTVEVENIRPHRRPGQDRELTRKLTQRRPSVTSQALSTRWEAGHCPQDAVLELNDGK